MYEYNAVVLNVVDGDTFDLDIDLGFNIHTYQRVRLLDVDCPEKNARNGEEEKQAGIYVANWAKKKLTGEKVIIKSLKGRDSFGRYLVDLFIDDGLTNLASIYNAEGFNKLIGDYDLERLLKLVRGVD